MLKNEVELMAKMAKTIDSFTQHQTRLAVVIDGLDSCEQDKVLQMLDTVSKRQGSKVVERKMRCLLSVSEGDRVPSIDRNLQTFMKKRETS